jgi:hypothetical protein
VVDNASRKALIYSSLSLFVPGLGRWLNGDRKTLFIQRSYDRTRRKWWQFCRLVLDSGRPLADETKQRSFGGYQVRQGARGVQLSGVFGQSLVEDLLVIPLPTPQQGQSRPCWTRWAVSAEIRPHHN